MKLDAPVEFYTD